jgi:hypothetical protein
VPIFVARRVMEQSQALPVDEGGLQDEATVKEWLETLKPGDFGKYTM